MLKSWFIQNFKPILNSGDLTLAPVTVLAGRNSSGKSSLIQSILMIAQTLSNRVPDRALLPNGPIIQLGTFEDILSEQTRLRTLSVGFELEIEKEESRVLNRVRNRVMDTRGLPRFYRRNVQSAKVNAQFRSASDNNASNSAIEASKVNIDNVSLEVITSPYGQISRFEEPETSLEFRLDIRQPTPEELHTFFKGVLPEYMRLVPYPAPEPNYLGTFRSDTPVTFSQPSDSALVDFSHFLPTRLFGKYDIEERRKTEIEAALEIAFRYKNERLMSKDRFGFMNYDMEISDAFRDAILKISKEENISKTFSGRTLKDLISWAILLQPDEEKSSFRDRLIEITTQNILEHSKNWEKEAEGIEVISNDIYVENLEEAVERIISFFTSKIRYLGPLRADPQAAQKFAPSSELDDVGAKGEYAAAVYDANQNAKVQWYNPLKKEVERSTLKIALDTWVRYLGVADEVNIQMAGQSGVSWQVVNMKGQKARPLTAVGVGVSQILPILVMGLLAPSNTLLLVEQPELHLHPSVQARLGDFFVGLAKCDKQCLIETHSENLVSQLRYHIVQAGGQEQSNCLVYFVDQDEQGATRFNPVQISPKGNILNWPDGFFDETMLQEDRITAAGLKKRAKK